MSYLSDRFNLLMKRFNGEITWEDFLKFEIANNHIITKDTCRKNSKYLREYIEDGWTLTPPKTETNANNYNPVNATKLPCSVEYNHKSGTYIRDKIIALAEGENLTPEIIVEKHGLNVNDWEVISCKSNFWQSQKEGGEVLDLYQSKLTVKPKVKTDINYTDIDNYFISKDFNVYPVVEKFNATDSNSEEYLEIDLTDTHIGLLSHTDETNAEYDVETACNRIKESFEDIYNRSKNRKFKLINICTLGDILHVDNFNNTTTRGTPQDCDGRLTHYFSMAVDTLIECINIIFQLECPIKYTYTCGNHDKTSGYMLAKCIQTAFRNNPNIEFDLEPKSQKIAVYGNTLVGLCHGDMPKKNLGFWLPKSHKLEYGQAKFAQIHCGHLHDEAVKVESNGVVIYTLPSSCESSPWEFNEGYSGNRGTMCFVYNADKGLREIWYNYY